jgi:hypothetical protein
MIFVGKKSPLTDKNEPCVRANGLPQTIVIISRLSGYIYLSTEKGLQQCSNETQKRDTITK